MANASSQADNRLVVQRHKHQVLAHSAPLSGSHVRIALANLPIPATPEQSVALAEQAIAAASAKGAEILCFPECYVPGYRGLRQAGAAA